MVFSGHWGPFNEEEIRVVFGLGAEKAPDPDEFPIIFFQRFGILSNRIFAHCNQFYDGTIDIWCLNYALMALISLVSASLVNEFRPISLINASFKIISKVFANRLRSHTHLLVDQVQLAFMKKRYIIDSVACAQVIYDFT